MLLVLHSREHHGSSQPTTVEFGEDALRLKYALVRYQLKNYFISTQTTPGTKQRVEPGVGISFPNQNLSDNRRVKDNVGHANAQGRVWLYLALEWKQ